MGRGFDVNKYGSIAALSFLIVLILFTNLRHCFAASDSAGGASKLKTYEGEGCAKLQYMSIDSDNHHCPGEGMYAIAGQCLEYLECIKSTAENSSTAYLDYFQICEETQHFNGTGCSTPAADGKGDCLQKHCRIVEMDVSDDSEQGITEGPGAEGITTISTLIDEAVETKTELNSNFFNSSSANNSSSSSSPQLSSGIKSHGTILCLSLMLKLSLIN